jgi:hypothetical protein
MMSTVRGYCDQFRISRIGVLETEEKDRMNENIIRVGRFGVLSAVAGQE